MFADRVDAGRVLAAELDDYAGNVHAVVLGVPRGGVIVAAQVAQELDLPLDVAIAAKVGAPGNPEYAIGAVAADGVVTPSWVAGYTSDEVDANAGPAREKVAAGIERFRAGIAEFDLSERVAIIVDDGLATGLTAIAAAEWARRAGAATVVIAVPVASRDAVEAVMNHADRVVAVEVPSWFSAVGQFYEHFSQTHDHEVIEALDRHRAR